LYLRNTKRHTEKGAGEMIEKWWVIMYVVSNLITVGIHIGKDGEPKTGKYSAGCALIAVVVNFTLAYLGGVFRCFE
jgi:hypothetical protein